ncbi:DUF7701 domain-containing protein [Buchananella felis]|uniref:DUF7701 domain-containing protein n=1 Tax=Buchananella felis TaxID=3231492 RepID=UPI003B5863B7
MSNYLERDADLVRSCLPEGTEVPDNSVDLFRAYAVLMRAKGEQATAEDVHDAWTAWVSRTDPRHESAVPFDELNAETKAADQPFLIAIQRAARSLDGGAH